MSASVNGTAPHYIFMPPKEAVLNDLFMGEYNHSIDQKGRIIVPSKFRELLGEQFVISKGLDGCLWIFPEKEWDDFSGKLHSLQLFNDEARKITRYFMAGAVPSETDKQGRVMIPQNLRNHADLKKEVVLIGVSNRIEVWDKEKWEENSTFDDMELLAGHLGECGFGF